MSVTQLSPRPAGAPAPSLAERVRNLQAEARALAWDHLTVFQERLAEASVLAGEIDAGGGAYPVGAREIARRLAAELAAARLTLESLRQRFNA